MLKRLFLIGWMMVVGWGMWAAMPTKTLPIVYVNTDNNRSISDTETQVPASVYIDSILPEYHSLGTKNAPLRCTIKGRGNYTWKDFAKKPYKIKLDTKHKVLGMPKNRHWCLLAGADDNLGFLRNPGGFMVSEGVGLRWTPHVVPVELVLNGQYQGLYFLTEHVRIASHRVKIHEQENGETHNDSINGGWLVEINNYWESGCIEFNEGNGQHMVITFREPDSLSSQQRAYIEGQMNHLNEVLYGSSATALMQSLDIREAAKYYLVQEIMEDCESYHGSCMLYKDRDSLGMTDPWKFGPVWDFGNAYHRRQETWIYDNPTFAQYWIGQLASWPVFQAAVKEEWWIYYHTQKDVVRDAIREFADRIETAAQKDAEVWRGTQNYNDNSNYADVRDRFFRRYDWRIQWLYSKWGEGTKPATWDIELLSGEEQPIKSQKILKDGQILILRNGAMYSITGVKIY